MSQSATDPALPGSPARPVLGFARALEGALDRVLVAEPTYLSGKAGGSRT
jgi:hypothetical protein